MPSVVRTLWNHSGCLTATSVDSVRKAAALAEAQVDNYTANGAAEAFALILEAAFERQLSAWVRAVVSDVAAPRGGRNARAGTLDTKSF
ncbi:hypothetical protein P7D22_16990 [Lichenihabitans sp. Uapishka_5]|uniref:hypothetical protein n=1 Tax=Lichenihabitans sp. Uapishka_5 TaxID=3037302 RepID=UPI0029E7EEF2|nr:hypothetical protein [Lichenihabitans sp. Uapishka_5]MDX7952865.1 hypothetical protein [Lichenihabitans sp. Uapishka_5]